MDLDQPGAELAAAFARDGVACVRGVLDPAEIAAAAAAIEIVLAVPGPLAQVASGPGDPGSFTEDFRRWQDVPQIEELARHSRVPRIAAALMRTPQVRFYHDHVLVKEGRTRQRTPWHQDQPYYNVDGHGVSAWIPVDPVPAAGCLELLAGSHRGPWLMPRTFLAGEAKWFPDGSLAELPDIEAGRDAFDIRRFELEPGDAIFFDFPDGARGAGVPVRWPPPGAVAALPVGRCAARAAAVAHLAAVRWPRIPAPGRRGLGSSPVPRRLAVGSCPAWARGQGQRILCHDHHCGRAAQAGAEFERGTVRQTGTPDRPAAP